MHFSACSFMDMFLIFFVDLIIITLFNSKYYRYLSWVLYFIILIFQKPSEYFAFWLRYMYLQHCKMFHVKHLSNNLTLYVKKLSFCKIYFQRRRGNYYHKEDHVCKKIHYNYTSKKRIVYKHIVIIFKECFTWNIPCF